MAGGKDGRERRTGPPGPLLVERGDFGSDHHAAGTQLGFQHVAYLAFTMPVTICQRGIEERDPVVHRLAQSIASLAIVDAAPLGAAQSPAAKAELADDISRGAERPSVPLHGSILGSVAGHSHAAPRTPLVSPCAARTTRVATGSELAPAANRWRGSTADVASASPAMFDMPPPSTTTSGSSTLISDATARPSRSWYRASVVAAPGSPSATARTMSRPDRVTPVCWAWSRSKPGPESQVSTQ